MRREENRSCAAGARLVAAQPEVAVPRRPRVLAADQTLAQVQLLWQACPVSPRERPTRERYRFWWSRECTEVQQGGSNCFFWVESIDSSFTSAEQMTLRLAISGERRCADMDVGTSLVMLDERSEDKV